VVANVCSQCGAQLGPRDSRCWLCGAPAAQSPGQLATPGAGPTVGRIASIVGLVALTVGMLGIATVIALFTLCMAAIAGGS
jgi:hypothetical protein